MYKKWIPILVLVLTLAACQAREETTPIQIASYPSGGQTQNPQMYAPPRDIPPTSILVYDAQLALAVWDVEDAFERSLETTADYGGYVSTSNTWYANGEVYAALTFSVPAGNYDRALAAFKRLGKVTSEQISGKLYTAYAGQTGWSYTSYITLNLSPRYETVQWPSVDVSDTHPMRTFASAFGVLVGILGFLLDVAIWLLVVVGPFVGVGWGVKALWRRNRRMIETRESNHPD